MKSFFKKLFQKIEDEDFKYSKKISRSDNFYYQMRENVEGLKYLVSYLKDEWSKSTYMEEDLSTYAINRKDLAGVVFKVQNKGYLKHYHFLLEHIKETLKSYDYHVHVNKHVCLRKDGKYEELYCYFLKPKPSFTEDNKYQQRFGTIAIELKEEEKSFHFKLQCGYYSGFNYTKPESFEELLQLF